MRSQKSEEQIANDEYHRWLVVFGISTVVAVAIMTLDSIYLQMPSKGDVLLVVWVGYPLLMIYASKRMLTTYGAYHRKVIAEAKRRLQEPDWKKKECGQQQSSTSEKSEEKS